MTKVIVGNVGNTHSEFAIVDNRCIASDVERLSTADLIAGRVPYIICNNSDRVIWVASVVPEIWKLPTFSAAFWVTPDSCSCVDFSSVDATTLGADRVANAVAAVELLELPALVIDCGTAITFELIDETRAFLGGAILPGRKLMRAALNAGTAQLPEIPLDGDIPTAAGTTTVDALRLGIDQGVMGAVDAVRQRIIEGFGVPANTYLTGGDSEFIASKMKNVTVVPSDFTLLGVSLIAESADGTLV